MRGTGRTNLQSEGVGVGHWERHEGYLIDWYRPLRIHECSGLNCVSQSPQSRSLHTPSTYHRCVEREKLLPEIIMFASLFTGCEHHM